jgi:Tfp pilus assembly protein PilF
MIPHQFFLARPKRVIPRRGGVTPLDETTKRPYLDNYVSEITKALGLEKHKLFTLIRSVGYSLDVNVRRILASDQQESGDIFKASEQNFNTHTVDSMRAALRQALEVLEINPHGLPDAHVTAAYCYINLGMAAYSAELPEKVIPEARRHAREAFKADPKSSRALGVLGTVSMIYDNDWTNAKTQLEDALNQLDSNDAATLLSYAYLLLATARFNEAIHAGDKAARIDPTDRIVHAGAGWIHLLAGDVPGAIARGEKTKSFYPDFPAGHVILGWAYEAAGRYPEAMERYSKSYHLEYSPAALASRGHLQAILGDRREAIAALKEMDRLYKKGLISYVPSYFRALIFAGLNEIEECLDALEHACEQRCDWLIFLGVERRWDPVRQNARFKQLAQRVGIIQPPDLTLDAS